MFTASDVQTLKGTELPFLDLAVDSEAEKVYQMFELRLSKCVEHLFLRSSCWAKSNSRTPVSTPSKRDGEFERLIRGKDDFLYICESDLAKHFLLTSFFRRSGYYPGLC